VGPRLNEMRRTLLKKDASAGQRAPARENKDKMKRAKGETKGLSSLGGALRIRSFSFYLTKLWGGKTKKTSIEKKKKYRKGNAGKNSGRTRKIRNIGKNEKASWEIKSGDTKFHYDA